MGVMTREPCDVTETESSATHYLSREVRQTTGEIWCTLRRVSELSGRWCCERMRLSWHCHLATTMHGQTSWNSV